MIEANYCMFLGVLLFSLLLAFILMLLSVNTIKEGSVGTVQVLGYQKNVLLFPGLAFTMPLIEWVSLVSVRDDTDLVINVVTNTKDNRVVLFEKISITNQLETKNVLNVVKKHGVEYDVTCIYNKIKQIVSDIGPTMTYEEIMVGRFTEFKQQIAEALISENKNKSGNGCLLNINNLVISVPKTTTPLDQEYLDLIKSKSTIEQRTEAEKKKFLEQTQVYVNNLQRVENDNAAKVKVAENNATLAVIDAEGKASIKRIVSRSEHDAEVMALNVTSTGNNISVALRLNMDNAEIVFAQKKNDMSIEFLKRSNDVTLEHLKNSNAVEIEHRQNVNMLEYEQAKKLLSIDGWAAMMATKVLNNATIVATVDSLSTMAMSMMKSYESYQAK